MNIFRTLTFVITLFSSWSAYAMESVQNKGLLSSVALPINKKIPVLEDRPMHKIGTDIPSVKTLLNDFMSSLDNAEYVSEENKSLYEDLFNDPLRVELQKLDNTFHLSLNIDALIEELKQTEFEQTEFSVDLNPQIISTKYPSLKKSPDDFSVGMGNTSFLTIEILSNTLMRKTRISDYSRLPHLKHRNITVNLVKINKKICNKNTISV